MAASFSLGGNYRFGTSFFDGLNLAKRDDPGAGGSTAFLEHRFLLRPNVVIDDRFTVNSELNVLQNVNNSPDSVPEAFGATLGKSGATQTLIVRRLWLDWASDYGIVRFGRMPKSWGLGLLYDEGNEWDDFGTTVDRIGFQALIGNLNLNFGYEKASEYEAASQSDDAQTYEVSVDYSNPEDLFDVGLLYNRYIKGAGSGLLANSAHVMSIFAKKRWSTFSTGAELVSVQPKNQASNFGFLAQTEWRPGAFRMGFDGAIASATDSINFSFHPNYQPFLILFRQSVGQGRLSNEVRGGSNGVAVGSALGNGTGKGAYVAKMNFAYGFSDDKYILGTDFGYAALKRKGSNEGKSLGFELDLKFTTQWYDNFKTIAAAGVLFPGSAFNASSHETWGVQIGGALSF